MSPPFVLDRRTLGLALLVSLCAVVALWCADQRLESTRRSLVERRLSTAVDILREPAAEAVAVADARASFLSGLAQWGKITGLRLTLIGADGSVIADTEVAGRMPNLSDRPEVRDAASGHEHSEFRKSVVTGKTTLYVARRLMLDGQHVGIIRAATDASEVDGALSDIETWTAIMSGCCLIAGTLLGLSFARASTGTVEVLEEDSSIRRAA